MESNEPLQIVRASNGFIVRPARSVAHPAASEATDIYVFPTLTEVFDWLSIHFPEPARSKHGEVGKDLLKYPSGTGGL